MPFSPVSAPAAALWSGNVNYPDRAPYYLGVERITSPVGTAFHDLGEADARGRAVGAFIHTWTADIVPDETGRSTRLYRAEQFGTGWYVLRFQGTRAGKAFGPVQSELYFRTAEERAAAADRYLRDAKKRAAKMASRG